jgi:hypothetical protein
MNSRKEKRCVKGRHQRSASERQALIHSHQRSGLSQRGFLQLSPAAFCKREGISEMSLLNWRKKLSSKT